MSDQTASEVTEELAPSTEAAEQTAEAGEESAPSNEQAEQQAESAPAEESDKARKRIGKLTARYHEEREQRERLERELEAMKASSIADEPEPKAEDYDYDPEKFAEAKAQWAINQDRKKAAREAEVVAAQQSQQRQVDKYLEKAAAFAEVHQDFKQKVNDMPPMTETVQALLLEANDPALTYYLANNIDEYGEVLDMGPVQAAMTLGRIADKLHAPPPRMKTKAPEPPANVGGSGGVGEKQPATIAGYKFE